MLTNVWFVVLIGDTFEMRAVEFPHEPSSEEVADLMNKHEAAYARIEQRVKLAV